MKISNSLYKHLGIKAFHVSIAHGKLRFRNPDDSFDPFSGKIKDVTHWNKTLLLDFINFLNTYFNEYLFNPQDFYTIDKIQDFRKAIDSIFQTVLSKVGTSSFVSDPYNFRLWSTLAQRPHKGICLQFTPVDDDALFSNIIKVNYSNYLPEFDYSKDKNQFFSILLGNKSWHFAEEEEYILFRPRAGFNSFNQDSLTAIIFGCLVGLDEIDTVKDALKHNDYKNVILKKVVTSNNSYDFSIRDI